MVITDRTLRRIFDRIADVRGEVIEIGIFRGDTFRRLADWSAETNRIAYGVDSFRGMAEPTERDGPNYPKGKLSCGGIGWFRMMMKQHGTDPAAFRLVAGWVPEVLDADELQGVQFSFALVDLDQYRPTFEALKWVWPRVQPGGVIICDDFFPGANQYASAAVHDYLAGLPNLYKLKTELIDTQLIIWR